MKLSPARCIELIKAPVNRTYIDLAKRQEERLVMHVEPQTDNAASMPGLSNFFSWVQTFLPADKFERFKQLVTLPLETTDSTESIFDELSKFFDTPDKYTRVEFTAPAFEQDFMDYMQKHCNDENFWREKGWQALKTGINSFIAIDLPATQRAARPEPYYYIISISAVTDVVIREKTGELEYIIYGQPDGSKIVLDELAYRRFVAQKDTGDWMLQSEAVHSVYQQSIAEDGETIIYGDLISGLGYVPACSFYEHSIVGSNLLNKRGPITSTLSKLDWLLFWKTSKKYLDLYGAWPIVVRYKSDCTYRDQDGNECNEGYVNFSTPSNVDGSLINQQRPCPACAKRGIIGPGSDWTVDAPRDEKDVDLMKNDPVKFIEPSNDKLDYGVKEIIRLEGEIFTNSVGGSKEDPSKEAINEKQVKSKYEGRKAVLDRIREQFDSNRQFVLETVARLRYGQYFTRAAVYGGREYFLESAEELIDQYSVAKKAGLPSFDIARIRESYSKTKLRSNPLEYQRAFILSQLEPYPDYTVQDLRNLGIDGEDTEGFFLKLNFVSFIAQFERENLNVVEFASLIPFETKISIIQTKLNDYAKERISKFKRRPEESAPGGAAK